MTNTNLSYKGLKSTRFLLVAITILLSSIFLYVGTITAADWVELMKWIVGGYGASEVGAKFSEAHSVRQI